MGAGKLPLCIILAPIAKTLSNTPNIDIKTKMLLKLIEEVCKIKSRTPQAFGKVPGAVKVDGTPILGRFGAKAKGKLTDVLHRNIGELRNSSAREKRDIIKNAESLTNIQQRDSYLTREYSRLINEVAELKDQASLYGNNSIQGKVINNAINRKLNTMSAIEGLRAGTLSPAEGLGVRKISKSYSKDYNYTPQDGEFGRRAARGTMTSVEKARMSEFQNNNKSYRTDTWDSLKTIQNQNTSAALARRQEIYSTAQQAVRHYAWQRDLYRGTDWKPVLDREIMHNLKIMKEVSRQDSRFSVSSELIELLPKHLQARL